MKKHRKWIALIAVIALMIAGLNSAALAAKSGKININTASVEELSQLNRIGTSVCPKNRGVSRSQRSFCIPPGHFECKRDWSENLGGQ